jgi:uncharacterized membrane protein required for colicin V production
MSPYDAVMAGMIVAGMIWGAFRGFIWQVASLASLVLGYTVSHMGSGQLAAYFPGDPLMSRSLAMVAIYVGVSGGVFIIAWLLRATLRAMRFESFDRHLGTLLGGVEGALLVLVGTLFVVSLAPAMRDPIFQSPSGKVVASVMSSVGPVLPEEARSVLGPFLNAAQPGTVAESSKDPVEKATASLTDEFKAVAKSATGAAARRAPVPSSTATTSLSDLIQEGETRLSKTIRDEAAQAIQRAATGGGNAGPTERR